MSGTVDIRRAVESDYALVVGMWRSSYQRSHTAGPIPNDLYDGLYDTLLARLLSRDGVELWVAFKPGEAPPDDAYGWICVERDVVVPMRVREYGQRVARPVRLEQPLVHYVYVKQAFRRHGIARRLFEAAGVNPAREFMHTFSTALATKVKAGKAKKGAHYGAKFDPRPACFPKNNTSYGGDDE